jgi:hypothetical protein
MAGGRPKRRLTLGGGGLVLLALVAFVVADRQCAKSRGPAEPSAAPVDSASEGRDEVSASSAAARGPAVAVEPMGGPGVEKLALNLAQYKSVAAYPPWSRAFDPGTEYLLKWNTPSVADLPMDDRPGHDFTYHFDSDRAHVPFGEALTSWIEVWKGSDSSARQTLAIEESFVMIVGGAKSGRSVQLAYHDDGRDGDEVAGDKRYTNRFVPSSQPELAKSAAQVRLMAMVGCCDGARRSMVREFTYAPREVATILSVSDAIRGGSLSVSLDVDVKQQGLFTFEANLVSQIGDVPIGYAQMSAPLEIGRRSVDLAFFGRMFAEKGVDGPYVVKDIRGYRVVTDGAEQNVYFTFDTAHVTRAYKRTDFSGAEWDSQEKRDKVAALQKLIDQTKTGQLPPQPAHIHVDENGVAHVVDDTRPGPP